MYAFVLPTRLTAARCALALGLAATLAVVASHPALPRGREALSRTIAPILEGRFAACTIDEKARVDGIVVLGGHHARATLARSMARRHPQAKILLSGPSPVEEAMLRSDQAVAPRLVVDHRPRNTYENGRYSRELAEPKAGQRWVLITSAVHMPRAVGVFRAAGFDIAHCPVSDLPAEREAAAHKAVEHEVMGLLLYRLLGRTSALFPHQKS